MTPRVTLRPLADADLPAIEAWYPEAAATVVGRAWSPGVEELRRRVEKARADESRTLAVISRADEKAPVGVVDYRTTGGELIVDFIALAIGHRGWGLGSEAVLLLEETARVGRCRAGVHAANGLGLYFWLRLGYRPAGVWPEDGGGDMIAMVREA